MLDLFDSHFDGVKRFAYYLCGNPKLASFAAQESFLRIVSFRGKLNASRAQSMLYGIAQRIVFHEHSENTSENTVFLRLVAQIDISDPDMVDQANRVSPAMIERIEGVLSSMPALQRVVFLMSRIDRLPIDEIARLLSLKVPVVERKMGHAANAISSSLGAEAFDWVAQLLPPPFAEGKGVAQARLTKEMERIRSSEARRSKLMAYAAGVIVLIVITSSLIEWRFAMERLTTLDGKTAYKMLPDSSVVTLHPQSKLKMRKYGWGQQRRVSLIGEANFNIRKGSVPFLVQAGTQIIRTYGGQFSASYRHPQVSVECKSGLLELDSLQPKPFRLTEGMRVVLEVSGYQQGDPNYHNPRLVSWEGVERYYHNAPLYKVVSDIENIFGVAVQVRGLNPQQWQYTGFISTQNLREALATVCKPMGLQFTTDTINLNVIIFTPGTPH